MSSKEFRVAVKACSEGAFSSPLQLSWRERAWKFWRQSSVLIGGVKSTWRLSWPCHEVPGELRVGSLAFAPHVGDPRLSSMRCGWHPLMTSYCGRIGKVIDINERTVKLYACGMELGFDIELFDACLTRYCHRGCRLQHRVVASSGSPPICCVCLARVPVGASTRRCQEHDYDICTYCLGHPCLPNVGEKVIRGPTWTAEIHVPEDDEYYEEGVVETGLLDSASVSQERGDIEASTMSYHSCFQVRWLKSGRRSLCRGPPHQDVTPAFENGLIGLEPVREADLRSQEVLATLQALLGGQDWGEAYRREQTRVSNKRPVSSGPLRRRRMYTNDVPFPRKADTANSG